LIQKREGYAQKIDTLVDKERLLETSSYLFVSRNCMGMVLVGSVYEEEEGLTLKYYAKALSERVNFTALKNSVLLALAAAEPAREVIEKYGKPPVMYNSEINYWLWEVAIDILKTQPEIGIVYVHTTDYPMDHVATGTS
jgi:hypothetical protein